MNKLFYTILFIFSGILLVQAGNPDRQGEAGAYELLMIPWARTAGLHAMNTATISGVEAIRLNVAGLARIDKTQVVVSNMQYLRGTDISMNALGLSQRVGSSGAFGFSLVALDFGEIPVTTTDQPEGTGATFSPTFFHIGFSYAHIFENKVSVGITLRGISEGTADVSAFGFALDAGVQYVTGAKDNFKIGISLRNVGSKMDFSGEGLSAPVQGFGGEGIELTLDQRTAAFELPSVLNIGIGYDFYASDKHRITLIGNFTSNSFSQDQIGGGLEYSMKDIFMLRGGYKYEFGSGNELEAPIYSGLSAGASIEVPLSKENKNTRFGIDYAYRQTRVWNGSHNISIRFNI